MREPSKAAIGAAKYSLETCVGEDADDDIARMLRAAYAIDGLDPTSAELVAGAVEHGPISLTAYIQNPDDDFRDILYLVEQMYQADRMCDPDHVGDDLDALKLALSKKIEKWA